MPSPLCVLQVSSSPTMGTQFFVKSTSHIQQPRYVRPHCANSLSSTAARHCLQGARVGFSGRLCRGCLCLSSALQSMIQLSRTQDEEVGDGTTSVIILGRSKLTTQSVAAPYPAITAKTLAQLCALCECGCGRHPVPVCARCLSLCAAGELLHVAEPFLERQLHPTMIVKGFAKVRARTHTHTQARAYSTHAQHTHTHTYTHARTHTHTRARTHMFAHTPNTQLGSRAAVHINVFNRTWTCMASHTYPCVCMSVPAGSRGRCAHH